MSCMLLHAGPWVRAHRPGRGRTTVELKPKPSTKRCVCVRTLCVCACRADDYANHHQSRSITTSWTCPRNRAMNSTRKKKGSNEWGTQTGAMGLHLGRICHRKRVGTAEANHYRAIDYTTECAFNIASDNDGWHGSYIDSPNWAGVILNQIESHKRALAGVAGQFWRTTVGSFFSVCPRGPDIA